jgi:hypothetical protein
MTYKNPTWLKSLICFGIIFFAMFAIAFFCFSYHAIANSNIIGLILYSFGTLAFLYMIYIGIGLKKFINVEISVEKNGITVSNGENTNKYLWGEIGWAKNSKHIQVYTVYNKSDQPIFIVDHMIPGFRELKNFIESKIGI